MSAAAWFPIVTGAVKVALETAKALGLELPGEDELEELKAAANEQAARLLPAEFALLAIAVNAVALNAQARIASLGEVERCPKCNGVLTVSAVKDVHSGEVERRTSCSACGWKAP